MSAPLSRALALLDLLQTHRTWPADTLCARLEVTDRTLRRDLDRLRELGYRIDSTRGAGGGYRLAAGSALPPLLLTDDEAVTVAIGLRTAATQGLVDGARTTLTALAKLEAMLPGRLRRRVSALAEHLQPMGPSGTSPVTTEMLSELALACRDHERIRFGYIAGNGDETRRVVEPHSLVASRRAWFLLAWDRDRADWRTFRIDRMDTLLRTGARDPARELPTEDAAGFVARALRTAWGSAGSTDVVVDMPLEAFRERFGRYTSGATALDDDRTCWTVEGTTPGHVLSALAWLPEEVGYEIRAEPDVLAGLRRFAGALHAVT